MTTTFNQLPFLPSQIEILDTVSSTSDYLKEKSIRNGLNEGHVVWTRNQTAGRGQFTNRWLSQPGQNITLSILLKPHNLLANKAFMLSKAITLAVHHTISNYTNQNICIKWPNDVFSGEQKIAGILIENIIQGDWVKQSIVGIGLNVNQTAFLSDNNPSSLALITGKTYELKEIVQLLLASISLGYQDLQLKNYRKISSGYFRNLYNINSEQTFIVQNQERKSFIEDVLENGSIVLNIDGQKEVYLYGDAKWKI